MDNFRLKTNEIICDNSQHSGVRLTDGCAVGVGNDPIGCVPSGVPTGCAPTGCVPTGCVPSGCARTGCVPFGCALIGCDPTVHKPGADLRTTTDRLFRLCVR